MRSAKQLVGLLVVATTVTFGVGAAPAGSARGVQASLKARAGTWAQSAELLGSDTIFSNYPHETSDFGWSVAVSGTTAVVGAPWFSSSAGFKGEGNENPLGLATGRAYVFTKGPAGWRQSAELVGSDTGPGNEFGAAVAISGHTIIVGAPGHGPSTTFSDNSYVGTGRAYIFRESAAGWHQTAELTTSGPQGSASGCSVAISGATAMVSAYSAAYVFQQSATGWRQTATLEPTSYGEGCYSVAVSGSTAVVGPVTIRLSAGQYTIIIAVFSHGATGWHQTAQLPVLHHCVNVGKGNCLGWFPGSSLALSGNTVVVGAPANTTGYDTPNGQQKTLGVPGRTYIFARDVGWRQAAALAGSAYEFGWSVAVSGNVVVVGMPGMPGTSSTGQAYVFTSGPSGWRLAAKLVASPTVAGDYSASSVAISGSTVVMGAPYASRAFVFTA
jgi:hypothetical protein